MSPTPEDSYADSMHAADVARFTEQIGSMKESVSSLKVELSAHDEKDTQLFAGTNNRLTRIELALATALGGMIVLGWFINNKAQAILDLLSR